MVNGLRPSPMALDESSQESPGSPTPDLEKALSEKATLEPPVAERSTSASTLATAPPVVESGVEDEQLAEGSSGFRSNLSQASAKLSSRRRLHDPDNPSAPTCTESWAVHSFAADLT